MESESTMPKYATGSWQARQALTERKAYTTHGAMRATEGWESLPWNTQLPAEWKARYWEASDDITYVVWSYGTPIAWVLRDGSTVIPDVKYSVTTSKHQGMLYALEATERTRNSIADAAVRERQRDRDRAARYREAQRRTAQAWEEVNRLRAEREEAWEVGQMRERTTADAVSAANDPAYAERVRLNREQDEAERRTREITNAADREDFHRSMAEHPTWEDGWHAPRPYATTDGAIYSDDYLFRRNKP